MEPNKQTGEKPCSILKQSKTPSKAEYVPSPSTETILKRVSFSTRKLVKKFDQHGDLNSSCESSDMSNVSTNSIDGILQRIPIFHDASTTEPTALPELQSLKRVIDHADKESLKKCKYDFGGADKENVSYAEMSMTCAVQPREKPIVDCNRRRKDDDRTQLFRNDEMEMSLTSDLRLNSQLNPEPGSTSENAVNLAPSLNIGGVSDVSGMDMSMTFAVPPKFHTNVQHIEGLSDASGPQCNSVSPEPANPSFEMNMTLTCTVPSGAERPLVQAFADESQRTITKFLQVANVCTEKLNGTVSPSTQNDQSVEQIVTEETRHGSKEAMENNSREEINNQSFDANMSDTCVVPSNIREPFAKQVTEEIGTALIEINELQSRKSEIEVSVPEQIDDVARECTSFAIDESSSMDVSADPSIGTNNIDKSCKTRASSCLNNDMDGSFLKKLAEENRDLLTDGRSLLTNMEDPLADVEQLDDIEEPPTFMSGASISLPTSSNNNSTSLFDISTVENYVLENKLDGELNAYKKKVKELENALVAANKSMKEADKHLAMESVTSNHQSYVQEENDVIVDSKQVDPFEEMKNQVEQISSRDDCYWSVRELTTEKMIFGFISNSLLLELKWKPFDEKSMNNILDVTIRSRLKADAKDVYLRIAHDYCLHDLKPKLLKVSYTRYKDVIEMINFVYDEVNSILLMVEDLKTLSRTHVMEIQSDKFTITLNSDNYKEIHKITIKIKPIEMIVQNDITVECILGRAEEHKIRDNVKFVKRDKTFFKMLVHDLRAYLNIVSNN